MKFRLLFVPVLFVSLYTTAQSTKTPLHYKAPEEDRAPQQVEPVSGFDLNKVFVGGSIGLGLGFGSSTSSWSVGAFPQIGYSLTDWFDAGLIFNINYNSQKFNLGYGEEKYTAFNYGTGVFARAFPFRSVFVQVQPELNWIAYKQSIGNNPPFKATVNAPSLLVGVGFGQRMVGQTGFFTTIMIDVANDPNSPYRNNAGYVIPILRAGLYVYLQGKKNDRNNNYE